MLCLCIEGLMRLCMITEILTWLATPFTALVEGWSDRKTLDVETKAKLAIAKQRIK